MKNGSQYYMGIDVGTSETKGVIIDDDCRIVLQRSVKHGMENPRPLYYEQDAEKVWWGDVCAVAKGLLQDSSIPPQSICALGTSTLGCDCLPVDPDCRPLRKAILYGIDARAHEEIAWLNAFYGKEKVQSLFGRDICSGDVAAKILWIKRNEPEVYDKTYKFLTGSSYLTAKLTGEYVIDRFLGQASFRPLYREDGSICTEECGLFCRSSQLAEARAVHSIAGRVTERAAAETGLAAGTPVITGTGDSSAEAISTGVLSPGDMMLQFGSTLFLYYCSDKPVYDNRMRGNTFLIPGTFSLSGGTNTCGSLTRWYRDVIFPDQAAAELHGGESAFAKMTDGIEDIPPGCEGLVTLPYFSGERTPINDPLACGMVFGLNLKHTRAHLYRSALEGIAFSVRQHLEILDEHQLPLKKIMAVGGGTKSPKWMQIIADVTGKPIKVAEITVGAAYGDALMAALGAGRFSSFSELDSVISLNHTYVPNGEKYAEYEPYYRLFCQLYQQNKGLMHSLSSTL